MFKIKIEKRLIGISGILDKQILPVRPEEN